VGQINYTCENVPYTRVIEHKHFYKNSTNKFITYEYPMDYDRTKEPYYPINDDKNNNLADEYKKLADENIILGGRLGLYKYLDMAPTISLALQTVKKELGNNI